MTQAAVAYQGIDLAAVLGQPTIAGTASYPSTGAGSLGDVFLVRGKTPHRHWSPNRFDQATRDLRAYDDLAQLSVLLVQLEQNIEPTQALLPRRDVTVVADVDDPVRTSLSSEIIRLQQFSSLPEDWDSYGAVAVSAAATSAAEKLLVRAAVRLFASGLGSPHPAALTPVPDGGVFVEWSAGDDIVQIWISSDGQLTSYTAHRLADGTLSETESPITYDAAIELVATLATTGAAAPQRSP